MPYHWTSPPPGPAGSVPRTLRLWPHQSLPPKGFAAFILATFTMISLPTLALLGSPVLWALLPFTMLAVWGLYFALQKNHKARRIEELLTLDAQTVQLLRTNPKGDQQVWDCNRYWVQVRKYENDGPVPHYVTLKGKGREVEIGAFLSEEERISLFDDLTRALNA